MHHYAIWRPRRLQPPAEALHVKASGLFVMGTEICGYVCQRVEEGRGIMEDDEEVGGGEDLLPARQWCWRSSHTGCLSGVCRYGNMRRADESTYMRTQPWNWITHNQKGRCCYKCGVVREEDGQMKWWLDGRSTVRVMTLSCTLAHSKGCSNKFWTEKERR